MTFDYSALKRYEYHRNERDTNILFTRKRILWISDRFEKIINQQCNQKKLFDVKANNIMINSQILN